MKRAAKTTRSRKGKKNPLPLPFAALGTAPTAAMLPQYARGAQGVYRDVVVKGKRLMGRNPVIELTTQYGRLPISQGHIEFTDHGSIERYERDGCVYRAYTATPVFEDGYRMGAVESWATGRPVSAENPYHPDDPRGKPKKLLLWGFHRIEDAWKLLRESDSKETLEAYIPYFEKTTLADVYAHVPYSGFSNDSRPAYTKFNIGYKKPKIKTNPDTSTSTSADVSSPTSTSADVSSPTSTKTATDAYTGRNITVTGGAGAGATNVEIYHQPDGSETIGRSYRSAHGNLIDLPMQSHFRPKEPMLQSHFRENPRGRRRGNPESSAADLYEGFHGVPSSEIIEVSEDLHVHEWLGGLGQLVEMLVVLPKMYKSVLTAPNPDGPKAVQVCGTEDGNNIYFRDGDQSIDVEALGFAHSVGINHEGTNYTASQIKDSMLLGYVHKLTYRTEKAFDDFETIDYYHRVGEDTKKCPMLIYDTLNHLMSFAGGEYTITPDGIVN